VIQKLRELVKANPFRPFFVALADGRRFEVSSPDMVWLAAGGQGGLHFFEPKEDLIISVNPMLIASVEWLAPSSPLHADDDHR
jgi:hypothetical protein